MDKVKVILLRGQENKGKTATMKLVLKKLWKPGEASVYCRRPFADSPCDFAIVIPWEGISIGLISHGDYAPELKIDLEAILKLNVKLIVGTARSMDRDNSVFRVYSEDARLHVIDEVWKYGKPEAEQTKNDEEACDKIMTKMKKILNK